jgi:signal transduction histidine kinase
MRIQTRLFLTTAVLVLAPMGLQWWLYARELKAIEGDLARVATTVGEGILKGETVLFGEGAPDDVVVMRAPNGPIDVEALERSYGKHLRTIDVRGPLPGHLTANEGAQAEAKVEVSPPPPPQSGEGAPSQRVIRHEFRVAGDGSGTEEIEWAQAPPADANASEGGAGEVPAASPRVEKVVITVEEGATVSERFLVLAHEDRRLKRIPIPVSPTVTRVHATMRKGAAVGGALLAVGLLASAVLARRLSSPLRDLAAGAEAVGRGDLGVQVAASATGEIGELQRSFNGMSQRLASLEAEKEGWRQREHLAQLGDLSRGLAHTLRNPLHTLGLAVEELAGGEVRRLDLVVTARAQIRRIDRWLRSFLALGAGDSARPEAVDLCEIARAVVLESVQEGAEVAVEGPAAPLPLRAVPGAVRAALANLVENATDAAPPGSAVTLELSEEAGWGVVSIADSGPGLPPEVKERLFHPHVTTKVGGSGMGLFLARQLVVGMHGGELEVADRDGGGTVVTVRLPIARGADPRADGQGRG